MSTALAAAPFLLAAIAQAAPAEIVVHPDTELNRIDQRIYGQFLEHIYHSVVDGLWGQLVRGPSFEEPAIDIGDEWTVKNGAWSHVGHELRVPGDGVDLHVLTGDPAWTDYTLRVQARKEEGQEGFLIIFRALDDDNFYWWNLGGWGNQYSAVEREENGRRGRVEGTRTDTTIAAGRWYDVEIRVQGNQIECYLDGDQLCAFEDNDLGHGRVGLGSWATAVRYRDLAVIRDDETVYKTVPREAGDSVSGMWQKCPQKSPVEVTWTDELPLNSARCQHLRSESTQGGITQTGLPLEAGVEYTGSIWLRGSGRVLVGLDDTDKPFWHHFRVDSRSWQEFPLAFAPVQTTDNGRLAILVTPESGVYVDQCTLYRADTPYRPRVFERVKAIRPAFIRWPGGCYAERYRWKDAIGPHKDRVTKPNYTWGGLDPNHFGTAEFVQLCRDVDAEPVIVLNIGHLEPPDQLDAYVQEALDWVEYCNGGPDTDWGRRRAQHGHPEPFNVLYWEIGNETWRMGVEAYAERVKVFVDALREKDPRLEYLVCGSAGHNLDWNRGLLERAATHMDYLSVHHYMAGSFEDEMRNGVEYPEFLNATAGLIAQSPNPDVKIAVTEWNQQSVALRTGLYAGLVLNGFERYGDAVAMSCPALFIRKQDAPAWNNAFINHDSSRVFVAPNYLVMKLYRDHYAPSRIACDAPESLNVIATRDHDTDAVILKIVNPSATEDVTARITIDGVANPAFTQYRIWSPDINDQNSLRQPDKIRIEESQTGPDVTFPAHSVTLLRTKRSLREERTAWSAA